MAFIAMPATGQAQLTKQEQKCIGALTKDGGKLSKIESKQQQRCMKLDAKGILTETSDQCISNDALGKVGKFVAKTLADETKHCFDGTGFLTVTGAQTNLSGQFQALELARDLMGSNLDAAIQSDKAHIKCQQKVQKQADKILATKIKSYTKCAKLAAKDPLTVNLAPFENCLLAIPADAKVIKMIGKLTDLRAKVCDTLPLDTIFPGNCSLVDPVQFDACADAAAECRACTTIAGMNGLATDCDLFDNGVADLSCASAAPSCGDGNVDPGEQCDPGAEPTCCSSTCTNNSDGIACDDGTFCNGAETCSSGTCVSPGDPCTGGGQCNEACNEAADDCFDLAATPCDNGNFCDGTETCDGAGSCGSSTGDPCPGADGDGDCAESCDEGADNCLAPDAAASACDNGNFCDGTETCDGAGSCGSSTGDPCTGPDGDGDCAESCDEGADNCLAPDAAASACDDGTFCNGSDTCDGAGGCTVNTGDPCPGADGDGDCAESCDEGADNCLAPDAAASACDDGAFCNGTDTCDGVGGCTVNAGDPCPGADGDGDCAESCDEGADNCLASDPAASACDDGLFCTATDTCDGAGTCGGTGDPCSGGGQCNVTCNEGPDNCFDAAATACSDGAFCNGTETCDGAGTCGASTGDPCTGPDGDGDCAESCDEGADNCLGPDPAASACTDGAFCNGTETCDGAGTCGSSTGDPCPGPDGDGDCSESCDEGADNCLAPDAAASACSDGAFCNGTETCDGAGSCGSSTGDPCPGPDGDGDCAESCDEGADNCLKNDSGGSACDSGVVGMNDNCDVTGDTCSSGVCVNSDPAQVPEQCYTVGDEDCDGFADTADTGTDSRCMANGIQTCKCANACLVGRVIPAASGTTSLSGLTPLPGEGWVTTSISSQANGLIGTDTGVTWTHTFSLMPANLDAWLGFTSNSGHGGPISQFRFASSDVNAQGNGNNVNEGPANIGGTGSTLSESTRTDGLPIAANINCSSSTATSMELTRTSGVGGNWTAWGTPFPTSAMLGALQTEQNLYLTNTRLMPITGNGALNTRVRLQLGGFALDPRYDACHTPAAGAGGMGYGANLTAAIYGTYRNANVCP